MIRPQYPPVYYESELPDTLPTPDLIVIVNDPWKVGDLVDWWCDGCSWSGRITKIIAKDKVQVKLPDPPVGQGCSYEALCKDLRPSLDWTLESGWVVPVSGEAGNERYCGRLNYLHEQDIQAKDMDVMAAKDSDMLEGTAEWAPHASSSQDEQKLELGEFRNSPPGEHQNSLDLKEKTCLASRKYLMAARSSATLESAIMNLEELTCKIKWLKGLLKFGFQWSDSMKPSWKFLENQGMHLRR
ncbi:hypothetical protein AXF42_Ash007727 [Apostasia shenzhenica]|uniref:Agenet domain-containing protein n=1 Tax=Apostasia shenzhenica TaxID=1088818 RepID=A0A2I0B581_9ASPA|nr:hypothetical protein AXF42_Ash007727 [Apostasia shenzhenica]